MAQELIQGVEPSALPAGVKAEYVTAGGGKLRIDKPFWYRSVALALAPQATVNAPVVQIQANRPFLWIATAFSDYKDAASSVAFSNYSLPNVDVQITLTDTSLMTSPVPITALAGSPLSDAKPLSVPFWMAGNTTISCSFTNNESVANGNTYADVRLVFIGYQYILQS